MALESTGPLIIGLTVMFEVIAITAIALRFWAQRLLKRKYFAHDMWIVIGFICSTALSITIILSVVLGGLGQHAVELYATPWKIVAFQRLLFAIQNCWGCGMTSIRMSILFLYVRLFYEQKRFRMACYVIMVVNILWFVGDICVVWLLCLPAASNWDSSIEGHCGNVAAAYLMVHVSSLMVDLLMAGLPVQVLWRLQMPMRRKFGIMVMFSLVALICAITIARLVLWRIALGYDSNDFTYTGWTLYLFSAIEVSVGCTLACMPLLKPAGKRLASSSVVSWLRTLANTTRSHAVKESSRQHGWAEGPYSKSRVGGERDSESLKDRPSDERSIYVNREVNQHTFLSNDSLEMEP